MKILLDTHIFLWFISGDAKLPPDLRDSIRNPENEIALSVVSLWEAIIKNQLGKLPLPEPPETYLPYHGQRHLINSLPIDEGSVARLAGLPGAGTWYGFGDGRQHAEVVSRIISANMTI